MFDRVKTLTLVITANAPPYYNTDGNIRDEEHHLLLESFRLLPDHPSLHVWFIKLACYYWVLVSLYQGPESPPHRSFEQSECFTLALYSFDAS